jgi:hypothetical protein
LQLALPVRSLLAAGWMQLELLPVFSLRAP